MNNEVIDIIIADKAKKELSEFVLGLQTADKEFLKLASTINNFSKTGFKINSPKEFVERTKEANKVSGYLTETLKQQTRAENKLVEALVKKEQTTTNTLKATAKQRYESQQLAKANREEAILTSRLSTEYQKLQVRTNQMVKTYNDLAAKKAQGIKLNKKEEASYKRLTPAIQKNQRALLSIDRTIGRNQRNVGNYSTALKGLGLSFRSILSAFGLTSGIFLFAGAVRDAFDRIRQFDKSMQNLSGVMRTTRDDLSDLESTIIGVASATIRTSNEVAQLAESLATLGKSKDEIKDLLKPIIDLSLGLDAPADEAGEFLVQMLNTFGESTDKAVEFADTIATIRTSTTLNFQRMRDSFQYIAPISRLLGKDLAYTGSVVGILADNGLKAEQAGRLLSTAQIKLATQGKTLNDALRELNDAQADGANSLEILALANDLFGKQASKVGAILAFNTEAIDRNAQAIRDNGGALEDLTNEQLKSLDARLKILDSTYEGFILQMDNGNSVIGKFTKGSIDALSLSIKQLEFFSNNTGESLKAVFAVLGGNFAILKEQKENFDRLRLGLEDTTKEIIKQNSEYTNLVGSMRPFTEEQQKVIDNQNKINAIFGGGIIGSSGEPEIRTLNVINSELKEQNELLRESDVNNKILIGSIQAKIKLLEAERDAILGKNKAKKAEQLAMKGSIEFYEQTISKLEKLRKTTALNEDQYSLFTEKINTAKAALSRLKDELEGVQNTSVGSLSIEGLDFGTDNGAAQDYLSNELKVQAARFQAERETNEKIKELRGTLYDELTNLAFNSIQSIFQAQINRYDDDIEANDKYYTEKLDREGLSNKEREALEEERDTKRAELEKKRAEEEKKAFLIGQAFAVAEIAINLARTIAAINLAAASIDAVTLGTGGTPYRLANIPLAIGIAAAQTASVVASTIPEFKEGHLAGTHEGAAVINDAKGSNYKEIVERKSGKLEMFHGRNSIIDMQKGDKVHKAGTFNGMDIANNAMILNTIANGQQISEATLKSSMVDDLKQALKDQKQPIINNNVPSINYSKLARMIAKNGYYNNMNNKA